MSQHAPTDTDSTDTETDTDTDSMDDNDRPIIRPGSIDTDTEAQTDSPVERMKSSLSEEIHRDFTAADDDHPLVITAGSKDALESKTPVEVQKQLADGIYEDPAVFFREWKQNHIAAVVREAKRRVMNEKGEDALYYSIEHSHPELDTDHTIQFPKSAAAILDEARDLGYLPTIEFRINHDDQRLYTRDNGIAMTTGEAIELWNEPAMSGSGTDLSTAGNKGLGALTWVTIAGETGAALVKTRTRREQTITGSAVPERDQEGFEFYSYFGGILPVGNGGLDDDGFYGTEFDMPVRQSVDSHTFKEKMEKYTDIMPVQVSWYETEDGATEDDEFEATTFFDRYDEPPAIQIHRPGEFSVALDTPDIVEKNSYTNDTYLLDNPIERNAPYHTTIDTLWNDHIQVHNEQGLIVAGPNRGRLRSNVDELHGDLGDITDPDTPMPDVPLPEPVTSRDRFQQDGALERFLTYVDHIATSKELNLVNDYINGFLDTDTVAEGYDYIREHGTEWELYQKLLNKHAGSRTSRRPSRLFDWYAERDEVNFDADEADVFDSDDDDVADRKDGLPDKQTHPKYNHLRFLTGLYDNVDVATADTRGDPNLKENRKNNAELGDLLATQGKAPLYVGAKIHQDRAEVLFENEPDAVIIKVSAYGKWKTDPWNASLIKHVPLKESENDDGWDIPDHITDKHTTTTTTGDDTTAAGYTPKPEDFEDRPVKLRYTENSAVDERTTIGTLMGHIDSTDWGDTIGFTDRRWAVLFPSTHEEKISDNWHLSEHAIILKCTSNEAEALYQYPQVFYKDEFLAMLADTSIDAYNPFTEQTETVAVTDITDDMGAPDGTSPDARDYVDATDTHYYIHDGRAKFEALVKGEDNNDLPDDDQRYTLARDGVLDEFVSTMSLADPRADDPDGTEWRLAAASAIDRSTRRRFESHLGLSDAYQAPDDSIHTMLNESATNLTILGSYNAWMPTHASKQKLRWLADTLERSQYPAWENDSDIWGRYEQGYNGPKTYEKALLEACRNLGIDPSEHDPDHLEQAITMLATTCPEDS